ncbi:uracil-DNA glycosylase [Psychromonas sp. 14N.309.X.WAT.B.A12]|uniref:uracil-DNA glycosylase n=1 Tax=Psychromonas sp. 14N.309.X.WAT.B.A12 TaxID=2998322 RepID=UPI0025B0ADF7|nr:uracil-DNA glycosylase [Psychromonas sp. 14N.309.X.WAT.B.A12]MDN2662489.1 uracil-DNA glycosylase [Psychromonas sp. 14N.309.X.WAT.B.A12]
MMSWSDFIAEQQQQTYFNKLQRFIDQQVDQGKTIYPSEKDRFNAFLLTDLDKVKVVILGQDPYHGAGQAHGLSFSVKPGINLPPSLRNIYKELADDLAWDELPSDGDLSHWATQGVLLLNTVLTVEESNAGSHAKQGWEIFTDNVIQHINEQTEGVVFLLWGSHAIKKSSMIDQQKHHVLTAVHPSPLSAYRGFFGCKHFSQTNKLLSDQNKKPINW